MEPVRPRTARRPLPALVFLLILALLTAIVWWRVIHRVSSEASSAKSSTSCAPAPVTVVPAPKTVTVHVLNATNRQGLAAGVRSKLAKAGFVVADIGNDDVPIAGVAEIRYGPAGRAAAKLVAYYFPGATLIGSARTDNQVEISLGAKFTTVSTTATVKQGMTRDHVTQAEVGPSGSVSTPAPNAGAGAVLSGQTSVASSTSRSAMKSGAMDPPAAATTGFPIGRPGSPLRTQPASSAIRAPAAQSQAFSPTSK